VQNHSAIFKQTVRVLILFVTKLRFILLTFIVFLIAIASSFYYYQSELKTPLNLPLKNITLDIEQGDSLNKVLQKLSRMKVISPSISWVAKLYAKDQQLSNKIKVGEFSLTAGMTVPALFELITSNKQISYNIRFIEGSTFRQMQQILQESTQLKQHLSGKSDAEILKALGISAKHLEGQFYPDTYTYHKNDTDIDILKRAHKRLQAILNEEWAAKQKDLVLKTAYDALILASIVEKETGAAHERGEISGVFIRRLKKNMRLQTDPTVIYGLGERYQGNITRKHLKEKTPYNTYRINGLPPSPIAMVGREAIHAAVNPQKGSSLYFVAKGDGTHQFSETISQHNKAVREFQLKRRAGYRSTQ